MPESFYIFARHLNYRIFSDVSQYEIVIFSEPKQNERSDYYV